MAQPVTEPALIGKDSKHTYNLSDLPCGFAKAGEFRVGSGEVIVPSHWAMNGYNALDNLGNEQQVDAMKRLFTLATNELKTANNPVVKDSVGANKGEAATVFDRRFFGLGRAEVWYLLENISTMMSADANPKASNASNVHDLKLILRDFYNTVLDMALKKEGEALKFNPLPARPGTTVQNKNQAPPV